MSNDQPSQPQQPLVSKAPKLRQNGEIDKRSLTWYKRGRDPSPINGEKLMPELVKAALGAKSFTGATEGLSHEGKKYLSQALKRDVDEWRGEFAAKLRAASEDLLDLTMQEMEQIPPAARAYTLAVLVDKAQALEGKSAMSAANVNVQINNFGSASKEDLIRKLRGEIDELPVQATEAKD